MNITINAVKYACNKADEKCPGENEGNENWRNAYDEAFDEILKCSATHLPPIKSYGTKQFCKDMGIPLEDFTEAFYQIDLGISKERKDALDSIFKYTPMINANGFQEDIAINSLHPCLIKMIFAYLQKPNLIDEAFSIIEKYGRD